MRVRGTGKGRLTRRALRRGGTGLGSRLNDTLAAWPGVKITPMFGRWGYFVLGQLFACYPLKEKEHDLWIRLGRADQAKALGTSGITPHRRFAGRGWIECKVASPADVSRALRWLRRSYELVKRDAETKSG